MLVKDGYSRHAWEYFLEHKSDSGDASSKFLADARADGVPVGRFDNGGEFVGGELEKCANSFASSKNSLKPIVQRRTAL